MAKPDIPPGPRLDAFAEFLVDVGPELSRSGFWIDLYPSDPAAERRAKRSDWTQRAFRRAFPGALQPFLESADGCRVFNLSRLADDAPPDSRVTARRTHPGGRPDMWRATYLRTARGSAEVDLRAAGVLDDTDFWWWLAIGGANPALTIPVGACDWSRMFAGLSDPRIAGTVVGTAGSAAVSWARRTARKGEHVVMTMERHANRIPLQVFSPPDRALRLFETALENAHLTSEYIRTHCTPAVRPMEMGGLELLAEIRRRRNDLGLLTKALEEGAADLRDDWAPIQALAAAELIAALNGRPPASFGEWNLTDHAMVTAWVAKVRTRKRMIDTDTVALARRVVRLIATKSTLPRVHWKTEIYRNAWRRYVRDLATRLA